jgi:hypothetical protein
VHVLEQVEPTVRIASSTRSRAAIPLSLNCADTA